MTWRINPSLLEELSGSELLKELGWWMALKGEHPDGDHLIKDNVVAIRKEIKRRSEQK